MEIDTPGEALALHLQPQRARGIQRELALLDDAQIDLADLVERLAG